jgi:predicted AlkP superfamily pyrophosphatase or phosphodiesterase
MFAACAMNPGDNPSDARRELVSLCTRAAAIGVAVGIAATVDTVRSTPDLRNLGAAAILGGFFVLFYAVAGEAIALPLLGLRRIAGRLGVDLSGLSSARFLWAAIAIAASLAVTDATFTGKEPMMRQLRTIGRVAITVVAVAAVLRAIRRPRLADPATRLERSLCLLVVPAAVAAMAFVVRPPSVSSLLQGDPSGYAPRFAAEPPGSLRGPPARHRVLFVGLDGASWDRIDAGVRAGNLPTFERLLAGGVRATLETSFPTVSPRIWTTMMTGVAPEAHGIVDFYLLQMPRLGVEQLRIHPGFLPARRLLESMREVERVPVTSSLRRRKAIWNLADEAGLRSAILGMWATWPAEPLANGFVVSDHASVARREQLLAEDATNRVDVRGTTWPADLAARLEPFQRPPGSVTREELARFAPVNDELWAEFQRHPALWKPQPITAFRSTHLNDQFYFRSAAYLWQQERPDFLVVYARSIDEHGHYFYDAGVPEAAALGVSEEKARLYGGVIDRTYQWMDGELQRLRDLVDRDGHTLLVVVSDHGWARQPDGHYGHYFAPPGILLFYGAGVRRDGPRRLEGASIYDVAPTLLERLSLPVSAEMPGRPLAEAFTDANEAPRVASYGGRLDPARGLRSSIDAALVEKLRGLGYVQ